MEWNTSECREIQLIPNEKWRAKYKKKKKNDLRRYKNRFGLNLGKRNKYLNS